MCEDSERLDELLAEARGLLEECRQELSGLSTDYNTLVERRMRATLINSIETLLDRIKRERRAPDDPLESWIVVRCNLCGQAFTRRRDETTRLCARCDLESSS